jgi:SPOR domain
LLHCRILATAISPVISQFAKGNRCAIFNTAAIVTFIMAEGKSLDHVPAWLAGAGGGAVASVGQFVGGTFNECITHLFAGEFRIGMSQFGIFLVGALIMAGVAAVVGFFLEAKTKNRWTLFLAGAAFTSIGTTALPGISKFIKMADMAPISIAYAAEKPICDDVNFSFATGLKKFFGLEETSYRVVVGSFKRTNDAQALADKLNKEDPSLKAFVGERAPCNEFYPVIVGPASGTLEQAQKTQNKVLTLEFVPGAYISKRTN